MHLAVAVVALKVQVKMAALVVAVQRQVAPPSMLVAPVRRDKEMLVAPVIIRGMLLAAVVQVRLLAIRPHPLAATVAMAWKMILLEPPNIMLVVVVVAGLQVLWHNQAVPAVVVLVS